MFCSALVIAQRVRLLARSLVYSVNNKRHNHFYESSTLRSRELRAEECDINQIHTGEEYFRLITFSTLCDNINNTPLYDL